MGHLQCILQGVRRMPEDLMSYKNEVNSKLKDLRRVQMKAALRMTHFSDLRLDLFQDFGAFFCHAPGRLGIGFMVETEKMEDAMDQ
jgi:hypothetical protein